MTEKELLANIAPFGLRMQAELKEKLKAVAEQNGRSMNAEIVARLDASLSETSYEAAEWKRRYEDERAAFERMEKLYDSSFDVAMNYKNVNRMLKQQMLRHLQILKSFASAVMETEGTPTPELVSLGKRLRDAAKLHVDKLELDLNTESTRSDLEEIDHLIEKADGMLLKGEED